MQKYLQQEQKEKRGKHDLLCGDRYKCIHIGAFVKEQRYRNNAMLDGIIVPLYHSEILAEYDEVLHREKFHFHENSIQKILSAVKQYGVNVVPQATEEMFVDKDDRIFYEIALAKVDEGAYLITGNQKHYPLRSFIVTPTEMMRIIEQ